MEEAEPLMDVVDRVFGPLDEWAIAWLIRRWRDEVWRNAMRYMQAAEDEARVALRTKIETTTLRRAEAIMSGKDLRRVLPQTGFNS